MEQILYKTSLRKILRQTPRKVRAQKKKTEDDKCFFSESARTCATFLRIHKQTFLFSEKVDFNWKLASLLLGDTNSAATSSGRLRMLTAHSETPVMTKTPGQKWPRDRTSVFSQYKAKRPQQINDYQANRERSHGDKLASRSHQSRFSVVITILTQIGLRNA